MTKLMWGGATGLRLASREMNIATHSTINSGQLFDGDARGHLAHI